MCGQNLSSRVKSVFLKVNSLLWQSGQDVLDRERGFVANVGEGKAELFENGNTRVVFVEVGPGGAGQFLQTTDTELSQMMVVHPGWVVTVFGDCYW